MAAADHWHPALLHSGGDDAAYRLWDTRQGFEAPAWQNRKAHGAGVCCVASSPHQEGFVCTGSYDDRLRLWDLRAPHRPLLTAEVRRAPAPDQAGWLLDCAAQTQSAAAAGSPPSQPATCAAAVAAPYIPTLPNPPEHNHPPAVQLDMGGGVWRAKWHPTDPHLLLAACMYNGFAVARVAGGEGTLEILHTYKHAPGSLSYGADWCCSCDAATAEGDGSGNGGDSLAATASFYDRQLHLWSYCP